MSKHTAAWLPKARVIKACELQIAQIDSEVDFEIEKMIAEKMAESQRKGWFGISKPLTREEAIASFKKQGETTFGYMPCLDLLENERLLGERDKAPLRRMIELAKATTEAQLLVSAEDFASLADAWPRTEEV